MKRKLIPSCTIIAALACIALSAMCGTLIASAQTIPQSAAQSANADDPKFAKFVYDIVSIKPYKDDPKATVHWMGTQDSPDGLTMRNAPVTQLIAQAYRTEHSRLSGAPDWATKDRYDMDAKMDSEVADALQKLSVADQKLARQHMLRVLVRDYLKVTFHMETTEVPIFELVVAKNGPKLKAPADPNSPGQGVRVSGMSGATTWDAKNAPIATILNQLSYAAGRPVYDKTGLTGTYDIAVKYTPDRPASAGPGADSAAPPDDAPSISTALEEQLGLKLVPGKGPMDMIVIDHIERPAVN
jgi:uncharacterized protein (TIGR03435 family)